MMKQKIFILKVTFIDGTEEEISVCDTVGEGIELMDNAIKVYSDYSDKWAHMRIIPFTAVKEYDIERKIVEN